MNIAFSQVLSEPRFRSIEKIKTIKSTYMAAAGLRPEYEVKPNEICFENLENDVFPFAETSS